MRTLLVVFAMLVAMWAVWQLRQTAKAKKSSLGDAKMKTTRIKLNYSPVFEQEVHSFRGKNGKYGLMSEDGSIIVEPKYTLPIQFVGDFAVVYTGGKVEEKINRPSNYFTSFKTIISGALCSVLLKDGTEIISNCKWIERYGEHYFELYISDNQPWPMPNATIRLIRYGEYIHAISNFDSIWIEDGDNEYYSLIPDCRVYTTTLFGTEMESYQRNLMLIKSPSNIPTYFEFLLTYPEAAIVTSFMFKLDSWHIGYCMDELIEGGYEDKYGNIDKETLLKVFDKYGFQYFETHEELEDFLDDLEYFEFPELQVTKYETTCSGYGWDYICHGDDEPIWEAFFIGRPIADDKESF